MNLGTKQTFNLLNSEQISEGCSASNFVAKEDNFYFLLFNIEGYRVSLGMAKNYSETSIEHISIDHEKIT